MSYATKEGRKLSLWLENQKELLAMQTTLASAMEVRDAVNKRLEYLMKSTQTYYPWRVIEACCVSWRFAAEKAMEKFTK